jgi:hypothetical protein
MCFKILFEPTTFFLDEIRAVKRQREPFPPKGNAMQDRTGKEECSVKSGSFLKKTGATLIP